MSDENVAAGMELAVALVTALLLRVSGDEEAYRVALNDATQKPGDALNALAAITLSTLKEAKKAARDPRDLLTIWQEIAGGIVEHPDL